MVSFTEKVAVVQTDGSVKYYGSGVCLSNDTKPTEDMVNGSQLLEMDTSTAYFFDEENGEWKAWE